MMNPDQSQTCQTPQPPSTTFPVLKGSLTLRVPSSHGHEDLIVPDPDELAPGIGVSPAQKYILRFIRENAQPYRSHRETPPPSLDHSDEILDLISDGLDHEMFLENDNSRSSDSLRALPVGNAENRNIPNNPSKLSVEAENATPTATMFEIPPMFSPNGVKRVLEKLSKAVEVGPVDLKRGYRHNSRVKKTARSPSKLRKKRLMRALQSENPFLDENKRCCKRYNCYHAVGPEFVFEEYRKINTLNPMQCKRYIISLYDPESRSFRLKGRPLCAEFVEKVYGFSRDTQGAIKGNKGSRGSAIAKCGPREVKQKTKRWYISSFLVRLANLYGDFMPNKSEVRLPLFSKTTLWKEFQSHWEENIAQQEGKTPSKNYFFRIWKLYASLVKVRRNHGFTVCSRCEMLDSECTKHLRDEETLTVLLEQKSRHLKFVQRERESYQARQTLAAEKPETYMSIILDGADQKNYGLPHFHQGTKADAGHKLKVKVVGGLQHLVRGHEQLSLYAMTEEYETGANHVLEVAHRMIQRRKEATGRLQETLFVQVDNCTRENKNRYFMAYFQSLVHLGVFKAVQVSFLPIGHTHADIDQSFSSIAKHLSITNAYTLADLLREMGKCYGGRATSFDLNNVINYSGLCEESGCLNRVGLFSEYRYFRFVQKKSGASDGLFTANCDVKVQDVDTWEPFPTSRGEGFLKFVPSFQNVPATVTKRLPNISEVNKALEAAEQRVKDDGKMEELRRLRDKVFQVREEPFHWNVDSIFELRGNYIGEAEDEMAVQEVSIAVEDQITPNYGFNPGDFVAVKTEEDENTNFWIAMVKHVSEVDAQGRARKVQVRWYVASGRDPWEARYTPAFTFQEGERTIYEEALDVACILLRFANLTTAKKLKVADRKAIKQMLDSN